MDYGPRTTGLGVSLSRATSSASTLDRDLNYARQLVRNPSLVYAAPDNDILTPTADSAELPQKSWSRTRSDGATAGADQSQGQYGRRGQARQGSHRRRSSSRDASSKSSVNGDGSDSSSITAESDEEAVAYSAGENDNTLRRDSTVSEEKKALAKLLVMYEKLASDLTTSLSDHNELETNLKIARSNLVLAENHAEHLEETIKRNSQVRMSTGSNSTSPITTAPPILASISTSTSSIRRNPSRSPNPQSAVSDTEGDAILPSPRLGGFWRRRPTFGTASSPNLATLAAQQEDTSVPLVPPSTSNRSSSQSNRISYESSDGGVGDDTLLRKPSSSMLRSSSANTPTSSERARNALVHALQNQLASLQVSHASLEGEHKALEDKHTRLTEDYASLQEEIEQLSVTLFEEANKMVYEERKERAMLDEQLAMARKEIEELQKEVEELRLTQPAVAAAIPLPRSRTVSEDVDTIRRGSTESQRSLSGSMNGTYPRPPRHRRRSSLLPVTASALDALEDAMEASPARRASRDLQAAAVAVRSLALRESGSGSTLFQSTSPVKSLRALPAADPAAISTNGTSIPFPSTVERDEGRESPTQDTGDAGGRQRWFSFGSRRRKVPDAPPAQSTSSSSEADKPLPVLSTATGVEEPVSPRSKPPALTQSVQDPSTKQEGSLDRLRQAIADSSAVSMPQANDTTPSGPSASADKSVTSSSALVPPADQRTMPAPRPVLPHRHSSRSDTTTLASDNRSSQTVGTLRQIGDSSHASGSDLHDLLDQLEQDEREIELRSLSRPTTALGREAGQNGDAENMPESLPFGRNRQTTATRGQSNATTFSDGNTIVAASIDGESEDTPAAFPSDKREHPRPRTASDRSDSDMLAPQRPSMERASSADTPLTRSTTERRKARIPQSINTNALNLSPRKRRDQLDSPSSARPYSPLSPPSSAQLPRNQATYFRPIRNDDNERIGLPKSTGSSRSLASASSIGSFTSMSGYLQRQNSVGASSVVEDLDTLLESIDAINESLGLGVDGEEEEARS